MLGGGLITFNPKNLANLVLWLDAANPSNNGARPANSSSLVTWKDVSGRGNDAGYNGVSSPTFQTNIKNGLPGILFNGTNQAYNIAQTTDLDLTSGMTLFIVAQQTSNCNAVMLNKRSGGTLSWQVSTILPGGAAAGLQYISTTLGIQTNTTFSLNTAYLWNWNSSSTVTNIYQNDSNIYTNSGNFQPSVAVSNTTSVGSERNTSNYLNGYMHEILLYSTSLSTSQTALVNDYLRRKWAVY